MNIPPLHPWNLTPKEAIALQKELAAKINTRKCLGKAKLVAGADVSYKRFSSLFHAGVVVFDASDWHLVERQEATDECRFPYVPGLLSFREIPVLLQAFAKLKSRPDVVLYDGHGYSHPRRVGISSHLGLCLNLPVIGCAKTRLCGDEKKPGPEPGNWTPLTDKGEVIGAVLRTKRGVKPIFVSSGHLVSLESAIRVALESCRGYRLPEPTRQAHLFVNEVRRRVSATKFGERGT